MKTWAICGYGTVGFAHGIALQGSPHAVLCGIVDPTPDARRRAKDELGAATFRSLEEVCQRQHPDAITIAAPTRFHEALASQAFDAGIAVLCEKPLSDSSDSCARMLEHSKRANVEFGAILNYRGYRQLQWIHDNLRSGSLTAMSILVDGTFRQPPLDRRTNSSSGILLAIGIHYLDLLRWWFSDPTELVAAVTGPTGSEYGASLLLRFGTLTATMTISWTPNPGEPVRLRLDTGNGRLVMLGQTVQAFGDQLATALPEPDESIRQLRYGSGHLSVIRSAAEALDNGHPFPIGAQEGANAVHLCELAYKSVELGQWISVAPSHPA